MGCGAGFRLRNPPSEGSTPDVAGVDHWSGKVFGYTPETAAAVATIGLVGMTLGALLIGTVTDVIGRRRALLVAVASFSLFTLLCAFAPSAGTLGLFRFLAGLGLGGCLPTAITLGPSTRRAAGTAVRPRSS